MNTRFFVLPALICPIVLAGCNGPTKAGQEARTASYDRVNLLNAQINFDQARQAFAVGEFDKALREINVAIERSPDQATYYVIRGRILMETHRLENALESFDQAITQDATLAEAHYFRGVVFERWSDDDKALESFRAAFDNEPSNLQYLLAAAETLVALNQLDSARSMLETKLAFFEHHAAMYELLGRIAVLNGQPEEAAARLGRASVLAPDDDSVRECLARAQFEAGQHEACLRTIAELQRRQGEHKADLVRMKARCMDQMGRHAEARNLYSDLTSRDPGDIQSWIELAGVAHTLGDTRRVGYCGARIVALAPERYEGYMFKALNEQHRGNRDQAIALLRQAAMRSEHDAAPHLLLGHLLAQAGDQNGALKAFAAGVRAEPTNNAARSLMAQVQE